MAVSGREILVIGAGIAGLSSALALARRGARVHVLEQAEALSEVGAGIQLGPNGVAVLEALGVAPAAARHASAPEAVEMRDQRGALVASVPMGATVATRHGRPFWHMHRADLLAVLEEGARAAGVTIGLDARVARVEARDGGPAVWTGHGARHAAELVVAADGARSLTRTSIFGGGTPRYAGCVAWRALVPSERLATPHPAVTRLTMGPGRHVVTYPLRGGTLVNLVAIEERARSRDEGWMSAGDPAEIRAAFAGWAPEVIDLVGQVEQVFVWGLYDHEPLADWARGPIVMVGDACHPMLPFLAQGAGMGLEDAWVLAEELDRATTFEAGLAAYVARRRARAERVQRAAAWNGEVYHMSAPVKRWIAHAGLRALGRFAPERLLGRFDWLYGADVTAAR